MVMLGQFACTTGVTAAAGGWPARPRSAVLDGVEELQPAITATMDAENSPREILPITLLHPFAFQPRNGRLPHIQAFSGPSAMVYSSGAAENRLAPADLIQFSLRTLALLQPVVSAALGSGCGCGYRSGQFAAKRRDAEASFA
jgi:hypothetical protein